jgi:two-component system, response regulator RegA
MDSGELARLMVVEDDPALARTLEDALSGAAQTVRFCRTAGEAVAALREFTPELMLLDVALPDGSAFDVLAALADVHPTPIVVAMSGTAEPSESFRLAQLGVRTYLHKPLRLDELEAALVYARTAPADLRPYARGLVGLRPIHEVEEELRKTMVEEALARAGGSRSGAARLLAVSRQLLQHMLRALRG